MTGLSAIQKFADAVACIRAVDPEMPAQHIAVLLHIYQNPGKTQVEIGNAIGVSQSAITRTIAKFLDWERPGVKGLGLVFSDIDQYHRSKRIITLTAKGERLVANIIKAVE